MSWGWVVRWMDENGDAAGHITYRHDDVHVCLAARYVFALGLPVVDAFLSGFSGDRMEIVHRTPWNRQAEVKCRQDVDRHFPELCLTSHDSGDVGGSILLHDLER